jgi:hypothetical protein
MQRIIPTMFVLFASLCLELSACAATPPQQKVRTVQQEPTPAPADRQCDATSLNWALGKVADDALIMRAQEESGAKTVRVLRPGVMVTQEFNGLRLNIRVDTERKVLATSCG